MRDLRDFRSSDAGRSLVEVLFVLVMVGTLVGRAVQPLRSIRDRVAVITAREAVITEVFRARMVAVKAGAARLVIREEPAGLVVEAPTGGGSWAPVAPPVFFDLEYRVELAVAGGAASAEIRFDGMGLGRGVGRSVVLRRGDAVAGVVVSSYGRARRI